MRSEGALVWPVARCASIALLLSVGCASPARLMTASTLGAKGVEGGFELGAMVVAVAEGDTRTAGALPMVNGALRYGVSDRVDLGGRFGFNGLELQSRVRLAGENGAGRVVSFAPSLSVVTFGGPSTVTILSAPLPLLVGLQGPRGELVFAPALTPTLGIGDGELGAAYVSAGASVGYAATLSDGFRLMPELAFAIPFVGANENGVGFGLFGPMVVNLAVGGTFGKRRWADVPSPSR